MMMMMMMWCSEDLQLWRTSLQWVMEDFQWCDASLWMSEVMRTYNGGTPHSLLGGGEWGSSPAMSPSWAMVWDHFCFPLVAPPEPPRNTLPDSSLDSCLVWTSNVVQASLVVPPLKNLHLRCNQMAAARSWVGPYHARDTARGSKTFSSQDSHSSAVVFRGGSWTRLR